MNYTEVHRIPGLLMLIDFEKAFYTISWKFIFETLDFFKFGPFTMEPNHVFYKMDSVLTIFIFKGAVDKVIPFLHIFFIMRGDLGDFNKK